MTYGPNTPSITLAALRNLDPCVESYENVSKKLRAFKPGRSARYSAAEAKEAGVSFDDMVWVAYVVSLKDKDIERRLQLWMADCAARVLHIYEKTENSAAPRQAIEAARGYARGEIDAAARAAARAAAEDAAEDAAKDAARAAAEDAAEDAAKDAAWAAAWAAAWDAVWAAAWAAAWDAVGTAAWDAVGTAAKAAAWDAAKDAEEAWQYDRLVARLSDPKPEDWSLSAKVESA